MHYRETTWNVLSMLSGVGVGAAMMYLFDPKMGRKRRHRLSSSAEETLERAGEYGSAAMGSVRHGASTLGHRAADMKQRASTYGKATATGLSALGLALGSKAGDLTERIRHSDAKRNQGWLNWLGSEAKHRTEAGRQRARAKARELAQRSWWRDEEEPDYGYEEKQGGSAMAQGLAAIGFIALGAGLMYVLDPAAGRRRRALARDKTMSSMGQASDYLQKTGRHLRNRAYGTAAEMKHRMSREDIDDQTLEQRVRSEMGRCVSNPHDIQVRSVNGRVTIQGPILSSEVDNVLRCVWSTRGVREIVNELIPFDQPEHAERQGEQSGQQPS